MPEPGVDLKDRPGCTVETFLSFTETIESSSFQAAMVHVTACPGDSWDSDESYDSLDSSDSFDPSVSEHSSDY